MFTSCPVCHKQYKVGAAQLVTARGTVLCGHCGKQFNALERLTDKPVSKKPHVSSAQQSVPPVMERVPAHPLEPAPAVLPEPEFDIPEILRDEELPPVSRKGRVMWLLGITLLVLVAIAQGMWFNRDALIDRYPQLRPWAQKLCDRLHCLVMREYRPSDIKLLNRDVRLHPNYADTLLVNATIANRSNRVQPYPRIQFCLFDTGGRMLAVREFNPNEYLDNSIMQSEGMPVNQPVHFVLEITGPTAGAVSFEFRFL